MVGRWRRSIWARYVSAALAAVLCFSLASPAFAWKPKTHVYLAQLALQDAVADGKVTLYETDYATGRILGVLGEFEVNPAILAALRSNPRQFYAGVVGPDAYPDLMTGQQVIHPGTNLSLTGSPTHNEMPSAPGADAWLTHLWRAAYGRPSVLQQAAAQEDNRFLDMYVQQNDTPEIRAFVAGYLTHAAGDMFMHTFVNHYAGGEFAVQPDPRNAVKHVVLEGYVGARTPDFNIPGVSIEGVDNFIYRTMVRASPGSVLEQRLLTGGGETFSVPAIFSDLRNGLQRDVDRYDRERMDRRGPARLAYSTANGPLAEYKRAWIDDIDAGLRAWPAVSHEIALAMVYNPAHDGSDMDRVKAIASQYVRDHLLSMVGVPDAVVATAAAINDIIAAVTPNFVIQAIEEMKKDFYDWLLRKAIGIGAEELKGYLSDPEVYFDPIMNSAGGGHDGRQETRIDLRSFNRDVLHVDDDGTAHMDRRFAVDSFAPAFNTLQMTKIAFLSEKGMNDLIATLRAKGINVPNLPGVPGSFENGMLGFLTSLDADNRWQGLADGTHPAGRSFFLAQDGAEGWQHLFLHQIGERSDWLSNTAPARDTASPPDDTGFETIQWWSVRVDGVAYGAAGGEGLSPDQVAVTATFRNDTGEGLTVNPRTIRTQLKAGTADIAPVRTEFVHTEEGALPSWHYPPGTPLPRNGRITVRFVYTVGDPTRQREVRTFSVIELRPKLRAPLQVEDGPRKDFELERLNADGTTGTQAPASAVETASDPAVLQALKGLEGDFLTNRSTVLAITVNGANVHARAVNNDRGRREREVMDLTLGADRILRGRWLEVDPTGHQIGADVEIPVTENPDHFDGSFKILLGSDGPYDYIGDRIGGARSGSGSSAGGFTEAGYLAFRADAVERIDQVASRPIQVMLTARNYQGGRQGLQNNYNTITLRGSDGVEYRVDGNHYGRSANDRLTETVWLEQGDEAAATYVFAAPAGVQAKAFIVREGGQLLAELPLEGLPSVRPAAGTASASNGAAAGNVVELAAWSFRLVSLSRGEDRDWEAVVALTNTSPSSATLRVADLSMGLYDAAGETRRNIGNFYHADQPGRVRNPESVVAAPGAEIRIKLVFPRSGDIAPTRYQVRESYGKEGGGPIPAEFAD